MLRDSSKWPDASTIEALVREAQRGVPKALSRLLATLRPALVEFFARRLTPDMSEDLAQSALVRISGALHRIDPARADAYVSTVARNLLRTAYRRCAIDKERLVTIDGEVSLLQENAQESAEYDELVLAVHRVIAAKLPSELADVVRAVLRGDSAAEIAKQQAVSPVTVRTRLMRARAVLRKELESRLHPSCRIEIPVRKHLFTSENSAVP